MARDADSTLNQLGGVWGLTEGEVIGLGTTESDHSTRLPLHRRLGPGGWTLAVVVVATLVVSLTDVAARLDMAWVRLIAG